MIGFRVYLSDPRILCILHGKSCRCRWVEGFGLSDFPVFGRSSFTWMDVDVDVPILPLITNVSNRVLWLPFSRAFFQGLI